MLWLEILAYASIGLGILSGIIILTDVMRHPQMMPIMNVVWPVLGLYFPVFGLWFYYKMGRLRAKENMNHHHHGEGNQSFWKSIFLSTTHCSSGCVIGNVIGAPIIFALGITIFGEELFAEYIAEFVLAYLFGIAFQFIPVMSMQKVSRSKAISKAVKADTWSLVAFEVGMFGWMAIFYFALFTIPPIPTEMVFWFMMQIGMVLGFLTSYPANWWLVKTGIKSGM